MPATFWLFYHVIRDRSLINQATRKANACRAYNMDNRVAFDRMAFDATKLCNQPLLQSCYAETLRKYVAVYIIRKPAYEDAHVLDYTFPKDRMIVVSSAMAHLDRKNWNTGLTGEHPVEDFWAERFLTTGGGGGISTPSSSISAYESNSLDGGERRTMKTPLSTYNRLRPQSFRTQILPKRLQRSLDSFRWWYPPMPR